MFLSRVYRYWKIILAVLIFFMLIYIFTITSSNETKNNSDAYIPSDHVHFLRLERDGDINSNYIIEVLFRKDHENIKPNDRKSQYKIKRRFLKNDINKDGYLDRNEIFSIIKQNIEEHIKEAKSGTLEAFSKVKSKNSNTVHWDLFVAKYLKLTGHKDKFIKTYLKTKSSKMLADEDKEALRNLHTYWLEADNNFDNELDKSEYLEFIHPEFNINSIERMASQIISNLDLNHDGKLSEDEFIDISGSKSVQNVTPYPGYVPSKEEKDELENQNNIPKRRLEFKYSVDNNKDGFANKEEIKEYLNPRGLASWNKDTDTIIQKLDTDGDDKISLKEFLENYHKILKSKYIDAKAELHQYDL